MRKSRRDAKPEHNTEGRRLLNAWFDPENGRTQSSLGRLLNIGQSSVSLWASGRARPETHIRTLLKHVCGIPEDSWLTPDEREKVVRVLASTGTDGR